MTTAVALAIVLLVLAAANVWTRTSSRRVQLLTQPVAAALLLAVGRAAGLSWAALGLDLQNLARGAVWGGIAAAVVAAGYALAIAVPSTHRFLRDTRYRVGPAAALYIALLAIPLGTVIFEEVAFRGVLWGLVEDAHGAMWATAISSALFGLWHVLPALDLAKTNTAVTGGTSRTRRTAVLGVIGTVVFTTIAGVLFAELRRRTGSLVAPMLLHWATNSLGVLAAARVWAISR